MDRRERVNLINISVGKFIPFCRFPVYYSIQAAAQLTALLWCVRHVLHLSHAATDIRH